MRKGILFAQFSIICILAVGCSSDDDNPTASGYRISQETLDFLDKHWSPELLVRGYTVFGDETDPRYGEGQIYFPGISNIEDVSQLDYIPLWISRELDVEEYAINAAKWDQFIFGWDDYMRASVSHPEYDYEPTYTIEDLRQPWVSVNREHYRQILAGN